MPKALVDDILKMGFDAKQFGNPDDFDLDSEGGYVYDILTTIESMVRIDMGNAVYDAALSDAANDSDKRNYIYIRSAEQYYCLATLWQRRIQFVDQNAIVQRSGDIPVNPQKNYERLEQTYIKRAEEQISAVSGGTVDGSFSMGVVESGHFGATA